MGEGGGISRRAANGLDTGGRAQADGGTGGGMSKSVLPPTGKMLDDLAAHFGSIDILQVKISEIIVARPTMWRMEAVAQLWRAIGETK